MFNKSKIANLYDYGISLLLIAIITFFCLKMTGNYSLHTHRITKSNYHISTYTVDKNPQLAFISRAFISNLNSYYFLFEQVTDGQVYTPTKIEGNKTNIKRDFSLANLAIVTAVCILA